MHLLAASALLAALLGGCGAGPAPRTASEREAGRVALLAYDCGVCHRIPGVPGAHGRVGPPLDGFGLRVYIAGRFPNDEDTLIRWIVDPPALEPLTPMPAVGVPPAQARAMAAYLASLR